LMRTIVQSRTYQLSGTSNQNNKNDRINYSHAEPRPLEPAVLLDAITSVTEVPEKFELNRVLGAGDAPLGARAMQMMPGLCPSRFMDAFGRSMRNAIPAGAPRVNLLQALHMHAGPTYNSKISQEGGRLDQLMKNDAPDEQVIEEFYLA